ncbi:MAG TPA: hypothetical protein VFX11_03835 [Candidatus Kapabacteria bacterium]|nr:hypothetical protein [Candidatus Kapabacteria bacterium]
MLRRGALITTLLLLLSPPATADIAIITHPDNPVANLNQKEVQKIFLGRLRMYPESELETQAVDLPAEDPLFLRFYDTIARMNAAKIKRYRAYYLFSGKGRLPLVEPDEKHVMARVASDPSAIGYVDASLVTDQVRVVFVLK